MRPLRNDLPLHAVARADAGATEAASRRDVVRSPEGQGEGARTAPALSVVVPMHDEEENVVPLVTAIRAALGDGGDYEIVLVDDGSRDATLREMRRARALFGPRVRMFRHDRRRGQSSGIWTGVSMACGRVVATLDGDGQNDPADIPRLVAELHARAHEGVTMVVGERQMRRRIVLAVAVERRDDAAARHAHARPDAAALAAPAVVAEHADTRTEQRARAAATPRAGSRRGCRRQRARSRSRRRRRAPPGSR